MSNVEHVYVYAWPWQDGDVPLIADVKAELAPPNLYKIAAANNSAGLQAGGHYGLSVGRATERNRADKARCDIVAPPSYILIVVP